MNLSAVVIWYKPEIVKDCTKKILSYACQVRKVYIVDNSSNNNSFLAKEIKNAEYIPNFKNLGIAEAQNIGCQKALQDGYDWALIMDQDSYFEGKNLEHYIELSEKYLKNNHDCPSFTLFMKDKSKEVTPLSIIIKNKIKKVLSRFTSYKIKEQKETENIEHPLRCYASGNLINLSVWNKIGGFDSSLFIDEVDFDFCIRLKLNNYSITRFNTVYLNHNLGEKRFSIFPKCSYHNGKRLFYIFRNKLIQKNRYGHLKWLDFSYKKELFQYFKDFCILDFKAVFNMVIFVKAFFSYRKFIKNDSFYKKIKQEGLVI